MNHENKEVQRRIELCREQRSSELDLRKCYLRKIPKQVFELTWLTTLDISFSGVDVIPSDIQSLSDLINLKHNGNQLKNLKGLEYVPLLKSLECSFNQLNDLMDLEHVPMLQSLECSFNQLNDLMDLKHVPLLQSLKCGSNYLKNLVGLEHVPILQSLDCDHNHLKNLVGLEHVPMLQSLNCSFNQLKNLISLYQPIVSGQICFIILAGNPVLGIPLELLDNFNCLESLKNYWQDLENGSEQRQQLKVQLVGNGRVGKTTLLHALEHKKAPDEDFKSTHGIAIKEVEQFLDDDELPVLLQCWDFGGQEIYHATHRLFLSDDCLYLLLWAEETEEHPDEIRHPVSYWLESIHDLGAKSPIILVKNQIDRSDHEGERPSGLTKELPGVEQIRHAVKVSSRKYQGFSVLRGAIQEVLTELKEQICLQLPTSWLQVEKELQQRKRKGQKTLSVSHFKQLCRKAGVGDAGLFVDYLHKTGSLFYRPGTFQNQIILDQNWVIDAVYRLFDPRRQRSLIEQMGGRFKGAYAKIFWPEMGESEHEIYLDFMRNSAICYSPDYDYGWNKALAKREFILPALLPQGSSAQKAWGEKDDDALLQIDYPFLHRSIIERLIIGLAERYFGEPWRTGVFCTIEKGQLLFESEINDPQRSNQGSLLFYMRGSSQKQLLSELRQLIAKISPHRRYQEFFTAPGQQREELPKFIEQHENKPEENIMSNTVKLFISYSHKDESHKNELELCLKTIKRRLPLEYWDDRQIVAGELVDGQISKNLQEANIVVLLISRNFFASDYCFSTEMEKALKQYEKGNNIVIPIIIRATADWRDFEIGKITALPKDAIPLSDWDDADDFWASVQSGISKQVEKLSQS